MALTPKLFAIIDDYTARILTRQGPPAETTAEEILAVRALVKGAVMETELLVTADETERARARRAAKERRRF